MYIYFSTFVIDDKHVIWEYSESNNSAKCIYRFAGTNIKVDPEMANSVFSKITGIKIVDGAAVINDVSDFQHSHPFNLAMNSLDSLPLSPRGFFRPSHSLLQNACSTNVINSAPDFEVLLNKSSGETVVYETDLPHNNRVHLEHLCHLKIYSETGVRLAVHVVKEIDYYFLRQHQIKLVRHLYESIIAPSINDLQPKDFPAQEVWDYFRLGIASLMSNKKYNIKGTAFEIAQQEEHEPIPVEDNYKIRLIYARSMMSAFFFLTEDIVPPVKSTQTRLLSWLIQFKEHVNTRYQDKLIQILKELQHLVVCTGLIEYENTKLNQDALVQGNHLDFSLLQTKIKALQVQTTLRMALSHLSPEYQLNCSPQTVELPPHIYSLRSIIQEGFKKCLSEKIRLEYDESEINSFIDNIIERIIGKCREWTKGIISNPESRWVCHKIQANDSELYIVHPWKMELEEQFTERQSALMITKKNSREIKHLEEKIADLVINLFQGKVKDLLELQEDASIPSTFSLTP